MAKMGVLLLTSGPGAYEHGTGILHIEYAHWDLRAARCETYSQQVARVMLWYGMFWCGVLLLWRECNSILSSMLCSLATVK